MLVLRERRWLPGAVLVALLAIIAAIAASPVWFDLLPGTSQPKDENVKKTLLIRQLGINRGCLF